MNEDSKIKNDTISALEKIKGLTTPVRPIIDESQDKLFSCDTYVNTTLEIRPYGLHLNSYFFLDEQEGWLETTIINEDFSCFGVQYHFPVSVTCENLEDIAKLIEYYKIPLSNDETMLNALLEALEKEASDKEYKWCKDFCPLFDQLGIKYSFGPAIPDWNEIYYYNDSADNNNDD